MKRLALLAILLAGCSDDIPTVNGYPAFDLWGNAYPAACLRDMSDVAVPISLVPRKQLDAMANKLSTPAKGRQLLGWYQYSPPHIYIWDGLHGEELSAAIIHEKCHHLAGQWHD